jgi:hypothetical protein
MVFDSEDLLMSHSRDEANICQVQPEQALNGITPETESLLRSRKKESRGKSEPELWKKMYRVLFPNEIVPSPCKLALPDSEEHAKLGEWWQSSPLVRLVIFLFIIFVALQSLNSVAASDWVCLMRLCAVGNQHAYF